MKIVVDAYDGSVDFYIADPEDPIIKVYQGIFPGVFRPMSEIPPDLRAHLRYPLDIFGVQTDVYSTYHMEPADLLQPGGPVGDPGHGRGRRARRRCPRTTRS